MRVLVMGRGMRGGGVLDKESGELWIDSRAYSSGDAEAEDDEEVEEKEGEGIGGVARAAGSGTCAN